MKIEKMSLATLEGKLSRKEMKEIMAGSGNGCADYYCGRDALPCCAPQDICSGAHSTAVCRRR